LPAREFLDDPSPALSIAVFAHSALSLDKWSYEGEQHASTPLTFGAKSSIFGAMIFRNRIED
jgi:hypothetical protein